MEDRDSCTWRELEQRSRRIGSALLHVTGQREPVAVLMEKGMLTLTAYLGAVYAGGFYVPLDPSLPRKRLRQILSVLRPRYLVTDAAHVLLAEIAQPLFAPLLSRTRLGGKSQGRYAFQLLRTFLLVNLGELFFRANSLRDGLSMAYGLFTRGNWLKQKLELPDRRTEENYQLWNTQLETYHKLIEQNNAKGNLFLTQSTKTIANQVLKSSGFSQAQESISP